MLEQLSKNLNPKLMIILLGAATVMFLSTAYAVWFKAPMKQYREMEERYGYLQQRPSNQQSNVVMLDKIEQEIKVVEGQLAAKAEREALKGIKPLALMSDLANYADKFNVQMIRVTPVEPIPGKVYTETPFSVDLMGDYKQLFNWIYTLEHSDTPVLIKNFSLLPGDAENNRHLSLSLGLIQLNEES